MENSDEGHFKFRCYGIAECILILTTCGCLGPFREGRESILGLEKVIMGFRNKAGRGLIKSTGAE